MDSNPEILKKKIFCAHCKNIHKAAPNSQNNAKNKLIINMNPNIQTNISLAPESQKDKPRRSLKTIGFKFNKN